MTERPETIEAVAREIDPAAFGLPDYLDMGDSGYLTDRDEARARAEAAIAALRAADAAAGLVTVPRERADKAALVVKEARILISQVPLDPLTVPLDIAVSEYEAMIDAATEDKE